MEGRVQPGSGYLCVSSSPGHGLPPRGRERGPAGRLRTGHAAPSPDCRQRNRAAPPGPLGVLGRVPAGLVRGLLHRAGTARAQRVWSPAPAQPAHWGSTAQVHVSVPAALPSGAPRACRPRTATAGAGLAAGGACLLVPAQQTSVGEARPRPRVRGQAQSLPAAPGSSALPGEALEGRGRVVILAPGAGLDTLQSLCAPHINGDGGGPHLTGLCAPDESQG